MKLVLLEIEYKSKRELSILYLHVSQKERVSINLEHRSYHKKIKCLVLHIYIFSPLRRALQSISL
jgi:hypothetical protein